VQKFYSTLLVLLFTAAGFASLGASLRNGIQTAEPSKDVTRSYLGFDRNKYPGDAALGALRKAFSFCGYWLNSPPGESSNTWRGKRAALRSRGFGFLVLFNGRLDRELTPVANPMVVGRSDAAIAIEAARKDRFPARTIIFLDQEEGGRMLAEQRAYVYAWIDGINTSGYRAGVYCSGIPVKESGGATVITANDLRENADGREITFFVYNDSCPPSPGCTTTRNLPSPGQSGVSFASVWQFAQSPRRPEFAAACGSTYGDDGNCYAPLFQGLDGIEIDVDTATSPDPSSQAVAPTPE
jgi:hypothetical protein